MRIAIILFTICLASCATQNINKNYDVANMGGKAILFGSITQTEASGTDNAYGTVSYSGPMSGYLQTRTFTMPILIPFDKSEFEDVTGKIFVIEVDPGEYSFDRWAASNGTGAGFYPKENPKPLVYSLKAGQVNYVGNIHFELLTGDNIFGIDITHNAFAVLENNLERDSKIFQSKFTKLQGLEVVNLVKETGIWGKGLQNIKKEVHIPQTN